MQIMRRLTAGLAGVALALAVTVTGMAYSGQTAASLTVAPQGSISCTAPFTVAATILDGNGRPVVGESITWSWARSPSSGDKINASPTVTNAEGVATTTVTLANVTGTREIRATAGNIRASAVLNAACGGLPITSTAAPAVDADGSPAPLPGLLVLAVAGAGVVLALRRPALTKS